MREESECQQEMKLSTPGNKTYQYPERSWGGTGTGPLLFGAQLCAPATC